MFKRKKSYVAYFQHSDTWLIKQEVVVAISSKLAKRIIQTKYGLDYKILRITKI